MVISAGEKSPAFALTVILAALAVSGVIKSSNVTMKNKSE
jgi:hypothetical protein